jgi:Ca-activated chloride channel homolog
MLRFAHSELLWLLLLLPALLWLSERRRGRLRRLLEQQGAWPAALRLLPGWSPARARWLDLTALAGLGLVLLALAAPQLGSRLIEVERKGVDVVVAVDVSQSMAAQDLAPDRMARARHSVRRLLRELSGDRVALVPFAGRAFLQNPLTTDYGMVAMLVDLLRPGLIPVPGTDLGAPIRVALEAFASAGGDADGARDRVLILLSDGEDFEGDWPGALEEARQAGVVIHAVGLASPEGAPVPDPGRPGAYKLDSGGSIVLSRLDEETLARVAGAGGGLYLRSTPAGDELLKIRERVDELEGRSLGTRVYGGWRERYQLPLAAGLLLLVLAWLGPVARSRRRLSLLLLLPLGLVLPAAAREPSGGAIATSPVTEAGWIDSWKAGRAVREGNRHYRGGDWGVAAERYGAALEAAPGDAVARFNLGSALAAGGDAQGAEELFGALGAAAEVDPRLQADSWYNRGTLALERGDAAAARDQLIEALRRDPELADARHNLELALRLLEQQEPPPGQSSQGESAPPEDPSSREEPSPESPPADPARDPEESPPPQAGGNGQDSPTTGDSPPPDPSPAGEDAPPPPASGEEAREDAASRPEVTPEQLEQILGAAAADERRTLEALQRQRVPAEPRRVEKDW